ncbi:putative proline hydroxylase [alpha proteobacterium Q-1]|nr:putative proline hydroxylase [alpha proteobacterium Q-1]
MTRPPSAIDLGDLFRLNPALDRPALARQFVEQGERIQINDILSPESAARLYQILGQQTPWGIAYYDGAHHFIRREEIAAKKPDELAAINSRLMARARHDYSYFYFCYPMLQAYLEQWQPDHLLMRFLEFLNSAPMLDLIREISGLAAIIKADAQATFYSQNHFLLHHRDEVEKEHRRLAYVFGFTPEWRTDWGGYLNFFDERGDITWGLIPRFNVLNLFATRHPHAVGQVAPFAGAPRLSITGWYRDQ